MSPSVTSQNIGNRAWVNSVLSRKTNLFTTSSGETKSNGPNVVFRQLSKVLIFATHHFFRVKARTATVANGHPAFHRRLVHIVVWCAGGKMIRVNALPVRNIFRWVEFRAQVKNIYVIGNESVGKNVSHPVGTYLLIAPPERPVTSPLPDSTFVEKASTPSRYGRNFLTEPFLWERCIAVITRGRTISGGSSSKCVDSEFLAAASTGKADSGILKWHSNHPRTMIGVSRPGWLHSAGLNFIHYNTETFSGEVA